MRWNMVSVAGLVISVASAGFLWVWLFLSAFVIGSGDSDYEKASRELFAALCALCIIGTLLSFLSPLASLLQMPGTAYVLVISAYYAMPIDLAALAAVSAIGTALIFVSMFVQLSRFESSGELTPLPRWRTWVLGSPPENSRMRFAVPRLQKKVKMALLSILVVAIALTAAAFLYVDYRPVSVLEIQVVADGYVYGPIHVVVRVDGTVVIDEYLEPDPLMTNESHRIMQTSSTYEVTAGEHLVTADYTNSTSGELDGVADWDQIIRILPFTTEEVAVPIGVGFI